MSATPLDRVKALLAALPKEDQAELRRYLGDILVSDDEAEAIHLATLETRSDAGRKVTYTYRSERVKCGKASCWCHESGLGHGPYTYKYWRENGRVRKKYVGAQEGAATRRRGSAPGALANDSSASSSGAPTPGASPRPGSPART